MESLDKKANLSNDYEHHYEHPLHPVFPLSGAITNPHPILKLGNIEQGANVVIGITTIKVFRTFKIGFCCRAVVQQ